MLDQIENIFIAAEFGLSSGIAGFDLLHHCKNVFLDGHLIVAVGQQNMVGRCTAIQNQQIFVHALAECVRFLG